MIELKIRSIIEKLGYIKLDDLMRQASSVNPKSYYRFKISIGTNYDFITAPEVSQLFGETIGFWTVSQWINLGYPSKFALVELGAGLGTLMLNIIRVAELLPEFMKAAKIFLFEINKNFIKKQKINLKLKNLQIKWIQDINQLPLIPSIIISNEFFDALPIKQYMKLHKTWYELVIISDVHQKLKFARLKLNNSSLTDHLNITHKNAKDGSLVEESAESLEIIRNLARHLKKCTGGCLVIDYGYYINPRVRSRSQYISTLQAIKNHKYQPIFDSLGKSDLSAHVDFYALKSASREEGVKNIIISSQREFLIKYGIIIRQKLLKTKCEKAFHTILDAQLHKLIGKEQMGEIFKVMEYGLF